MGGTIYSVIVNNYLTGHDTADLNADGITDIPYTIEGTPNNQDPSPLTVLVNFSALTEDSKSSIISGFEWFLVLGGIPLLRRRRKRSHRRRALGS